MQPSSSAVPLSSLTEWSMQHIQSIFEAHSDEQSLLAISDTFSDDVHIVVNGLTVSRDDINQLVLSLRRCSSRGLKVYWQQAVEAPSDPETNRDGVFGGMYVIRGIQKIPQGSSSPVEHERHKTVTVK